MALTQATLLEPTKERRKKILYIDDDVDLNLGISRGLCHCGYDVDSCFDGESGLQKGMAKKPDLVLLDLHLPKRSGRSVLRRMRRIKDISEVPVVVITGDDRLDLQEEHYGKVVRKVLHKPVANRQVVRTINEILGGPLEGAAPVSDPFTLGGGDLSYRPRTFLLAGLFWILMMGEVADVGLKSFPSLPSDAFYQKYLHGPNVVDDGIWLRAEVKTLSEAARF